MAFIAVAAMRRYDQPGVAKISKDMKHWDRHHGEFIRIGKWAHDELIRAGFGRKKIHFVPAPQHDRGFATYTRHIVDQIIRDSPGTWVANDCVLRGIQVRSNYERKKDGQKPIHDYRLKDNADLYRLMGNADMGNAGWNDADIVMVVDNVCATGETIRRIADLFPGKDVFGLVYALDNKSFYKS